MASIFVQPDSQQKLEILSADAQYDLACACGSRPGEHRVRGSQGRWVYPVTLPSGGSSVLFKTLISNVCTNDCKYCPLRGERDLRRCTLTNNEVVDTFLDYYRRREVFGLFLSSGVIGTPDATLQRLCDITRTLRRQHQFRGYVHLKILPGCSAAAVEEAVSLASSVSLNIETPGESFLAKLSGRKNFLRDIIEPIKLISRLTAKGSRYHRVKHTTQFIVGAAGEADNQIVRYMGGLYQRLGLDRIYFSAYQRGLGSPELPGEQTAAEPQQVFGREHRLYQVDFLMRKYGFHEEEIPFEADGRLSLQTDPKLAWAQRHPEFFPVNANTAPKWDLLRVPGLGPDTVSKILNRRKECRIHSIEDFARPTALTRRAESYLVFS
jgi:predicted DNA-binding helix-hairpin-helix protein